MKLVINKCYGGFGLSELARRKYAECKGWGIDNDGFLYDESGRIYDSDKELERHDPDLVRVVKVLGDAANGECAELKIIEIPDDVEYMILNYDGMEWVVDKHRIWR